ncbi:MAG: cupin domain-containing protein [Chloroflexota bacterium]
MRVIRISEVQEEPMATATPTPDWPGGPISRSRQTIIPPNGSKDFNCGVVSFSRGATTGWHIHDSDQILVITAGRGIVATEHEQFEMAVGDVVHFQAGENHWHGATNHSYMSHITITAPDSQSRR